MSKSDNQQQQQQQQQSNNNSESGSMNEFERYSIERERERNLTTRDLQQEKDFRRK